MKRLAERTLRLRSAAYGGGGCSTPPLGSAEPEALAQGKRGFRVLRSNLAAVAASFGKHLDDSRLNYASQILGSDQVADTCLTFMRDLTSAHELGPLHDSLKAYGEAERQLLVLRKDLESYVHDKFVKPVNEFLDLEGRRIAASKDIYKNTKKSYDAARTKLSDVEGQTKTDTTKLYAEQLEMAKLQTEYELTQTRVCWDLQDANSQKDYVFLSHLRKLMLTQYQYFQNCAAVFEGMMPLVEQLQSDCEKAKQESEKAKTDRIAEMSTSLQYKANDKYFPFLQILTSPKLMLAESLTSLLDQSAWDDLVVSLVRILDYTSTAMPIISTEIKKEVSETRDPSTMFRGNSLASRLMTAFTKVVGRNYLVSTLRPSVQYVADYPDGYEIDAMKNVGETINVVQNAENLVITCRNFLDHILGSTGNCPIPLRLICKCLRDEVTDKFGERPGLVAVGGYMFLRFFCPNILAPSNMGILPARPPTSTERALMLVTKNLQSVVNDIDLSNMREEYMQVMNSFYIEYKPKVTEWFRELTTFSPTMQDSYVPCASRQELETVDLPKLDNTCRTNFKSLEKKLDKVFYILLLCDH
eukprot:TRINITY_DN2941_c0_g1_i2.p1 TRINITY_DN2941_c0_g1~~TRINITY_DN2941_c0_g1_i2.p1  ORF type:complete len:585 (-),score=115.62 TRINITY_DN2941_c0_g1_i2:677-2431(-)